MSEEIYDNGQQPIPMSTFTLDNDIDVPPLQGRKPNHKPPEYPFARMEIGQSFFTPGFSMAAKVAASEFGQLHPPKQFTARAMNPDPVTGTAGIRIWRIK